MMDTALLDFVTQIPKAELHVHLEGTIEPSDMFAFAARNGINLRWQTEQELQGAYSYDSLDDFLVLLWEGCRALATRDDFYDLTMNYLRRAAAQGVVRAEMSISPQTFLDRVTLRDQIDGITNAIRDAETDLGVEAGILIGIQRHRSEAEAYDVIDLMRPHHDDVLGIGLGGPEFGNPPAKFERVFLDARNKGYRLTAHAGEEGPAAYVREALESCRVDRIDHGNSGIRDAKVLDLLRATATPLTLCPLSNLKLRVEADLSDHPVRAALDAGLVASLHSDDPAYFGGYIAQNYYAAATDTALSLDELAMLAVNSFVGSFADPGTIDDAVARVHAFTRNHTMPPS